MYMDIFGICEKGPPNVELIEPSVALYASRMAVYDHDVLIMLLIWKSDSLKCGKGKLYT